MTYGVSRKKNIPNHGILGLDKERRTGNGHYKHEKLPNRLSFILVVCTRMTAIMCLLVPQESRTVPITRLIV